MAADVPADLQRVNLHSPSPTFPSMSRRRFGANEKAEPSGFQSAMTLLKTAIWHVVKRFQTGKSASIRQSSRMLTCSPPESAFIETDRTFGVEFHVSEALDTKPSRFR